MIKRGPRVICCHSAAEDGVLCAAVPRMFLSGQQAYPYVLVTATIVSSGKRRAHWAGQLLIPGSRCSNESKLKIELGS